MTIEEHINHWLNGAENDIQVADNLFKMANYDWCLFIAHIVLEKTLKAIYILKNNNKIPPKTHKLFKLAELANLNLTYEQKSFLDEVTDFNIEARYPQYKQEFNKICTKDYTQNYLKKTKDMHKWLKSQIELS